MAAADEPIDTPNRPPANSSVDAEGSPAAEGRGVQEPGPVVSATAKDDRRVAVTRQRHALVVKAA